MRKRKRIRRFLGYTFVIRTVDNMPDFDSDPYFQQQFNDMKAFLIKHPHPGVTDEMIDQFKKDLELANYSS